MLRNVNKIINSLHELLHSQWVFRSFTLVWRHVFNVLHVQPFRLEVQVHVV